MRETIEAIYEHGVLRPLSPLVLPERERVSVTIETSQEEWIDHGALDLADEETDPDISLARVRERLSRYSGNWSDDIIRERGLVITQCGTPQ